MQSALRREGVLVIAARIENPSADRAQPQADLQLVRRILQLASNREDAASVAFETPEWSGDALVVDAHLSGLTARAVGSTIVATTAALETARRVARRLALRGADSADTDDEVRTVVENLSAEESRAAGARRVIAEHLQRLASSSALVEAAHRGLTLRASGWQRVSIA